MYPHPAVSSTAFLIADPTRAAMLMALADGRAQPAGELAYAAGVTAQTASSHLAKLLAGGLLSVETQGRHRYYRLAGSHVTLVLENLASIAPSGPVRRMPRSREAQDLQFARCCYDHLAGGLGVAVTQALQDRALVVATDDKQFDATPAGVEWFNSMGLDMAGLKPTPGAVSAATRKKAAKDTQAGQHKTQSSASRRSAAECSAAARKGWQTRRAAASKAGATWHAR
ncbi:MAG: Transcriptional regulator, ArsR family [uncultured Caballeronia sp.]|nr:MAG: Transcriptional regulator, ArsR family [uncultured Caballeronia sp.]